MHFVVIARDKPDHVDIRMAARPRHVEWLKANPIRIAGPFMSDDGKTMIGSMLVFEADSVEDVEAMMAKDSFAEVELFESVEIRPWKWTVGDPEAN